MKTATELCTRPFFIFNKTVTREIPVATLAEETLQMTEEWEKIEKMVLPQVTFLAGGGQLVFNSDLMTVRRAATLGENNNDDGNTKMTQI